MASGKDFDVRFTYKQDYMLPQPDQIPDFYGDYFDTSRDELPTTFQYIHAMQSYVGSPPLGTTYVNETTNGMTNAAWMHNWQGFIVAVSYTHLDVYKRQNQGCWLKPSFRALTRPG